MCIIFHLLRIFNRSQSWKWILLEVLTVIKFNFVIILLNINQIILLCRQNSTCGNWRQNKIIVVPREIQLNLWVIISRILIFIITIFLRVILQTWICYSNIALWCILSLIYCSIFNVISISLLNIITKRVLVFTITTPSCFWFYIGYVSWSI